MYLKKVKRTEQEQLFEKLRQVPLLGQPDKFPYAEAEFEIRLANPRNLQPSAFYVLRLELGFLSLLLDELSRYLGGVKK